MLSWLATGNGLLPRLVMNTEDSQWSVLLDKNNHTFQANLIESPLVYSKRVIKKTSVTGGSLSLIEIYFECS